MRRPLARFARRLFSLTVRCRGIIVGVMSEDLPDNFHLVEHPLIADRLAQVRDASTPSSQFRQWLVEIGLMLGYEATRDMKVESVRTHTPLEPCEVERLKGPVTIVPILRAGLIMAEGILAIVPDAQVGHIGMFRDEEELRPVSYYESLPTKIAAGPVLLVDPILATGGSAMAAMELLKGRGCRDVRFICLVAAPEGLERFTGEYPDVPIYAAALDRELDERGYILPGLGDAGDRAYNTTD